MGLKNLAKDSDIAIVGMACRFPEANNPKIFWENLCEGVESIRFFDKNQTTSVRFDDENYVQAGSVLEDIEFFDAGFFNFSVKDAEITDPQHRLFLECAWEALEDAGYNPYQYPGSIGVYAGVGFNTYLINNVHPNCEFSQNRNFLGSMMNMKVMLGNDKDYLPTQVSYKFNLRGPSVNVQTACSTSLVAVHMACQSILNGECDMALVGASNIIIPQKIGYFYQENMVFSPDGHCRSFDAEAQGTVFGSGVGVVLLKPLLKAIEDNDAVYAVIKGTAINNDGAVKVGYTAPSVEGQAAVIEEALSVAGVESESITYVETHGTATPLGDPIEVIALTQAFNSKKKAFCAIGSVKTNLGHLGWTAGMAGLIKTVLSLQHKQIPASLHFKRPNPRIDFANSPFYVNAEHRDWTKDNFPRRAGVSAFGIGGTNAHVILEEMPDLPKQPKIVFSYYVLTLSAKTQLALVELAGRYLEIVDSLPEEELPNLCYTTQVGRSHFKYRLGLIATSGRDLSKKLEAYLKSDTRKMEVISSEKSFLAQQLLKNRNIEFLLEGKLDEEKTQDSRKTKSSLILNLCKDPVECEKIMTALRELYVSGATIRWNLFHKGHSRTRLHLPTYPFQRERYWIGDSEPTQKSIDSLAKFKDMSIS